MRFLAPLALVLLALAPAAGASPPTLLIAERAPSVAAHVRRELVRRGLRPVDPAPIEAPQTDGEQVQRDAIVQQVAANLKRAEELFYQVKAAAAAQALSEELARSAEALAYAGRFDLLRALQLWLGVCETKLGHKERARSAFRAAAALDDRAPDPERFPPAIGHAYSEAARELAASAKGMLEVRVAPTSAGVELSVDGRPVARTWIEMPQGTHWLEAGALGFARAVRRVEIKAGVQRLALALEPATRSQLALELRRRARGGKLERERPAVAAAIGRLQGAGDALVVVERAVAAQGKQLLAIKLERVRCADGTVVASAGEGGLGRDAGALEAAVRRALLALWPPPREGAAPQPPGNGGAGRVPVYKRWWFWAIIGGSAAAIAGGTAAIVVASKQKPTIHYTARVGQ